MFYQSNRFTRSDRPTVQPSDRKDGLNCLEHRAARGGRGCAIDGDGEHRSGDGTTVEALVQQYGLRLLGLAVSQLGDRTTAEEIVQDVFFRAHQQLQRGRPVTWSWLAQSVVWRTRRARHARWRRHEVPADLLALPASGSPPPEPSLLAQIQALEPAHAEALLLHHWAGFSVEETAAILGIPVGTVKSRLSRARAALKHQWAEDASEARRTKRDGRGTRA